MTYEECKRANEELIIKFLKNGCVAESEWDEITDALLEYFSEYGVSESLRAAIGLVGPYYFVDKDMENEKK